jgi:hypothetical protein
MVAEQEDHFRPEDTAGISPVRARPIHFRPGAIRLY